MAYNDFTDGKPVGTDNGLVTVDYMRENLMALRDSVVMAAMPGWNYSKTGTEQPSIVLYSKGTERVRGTLTWGTSGGADGNVTIAVWAYSANSGTLYETIGTETIAYDTSGNVTTVTWS